jgi:quercetin dioxygenase-like cupin family protein
MSRLKLILVVTSLAVSGAFAVVRGQSEQPAPYVLGWNEGELLTNDRHLTSINVSPETGSTDLSFMTTEVSPGAGILIHRHQLQEEVLFVHRGSGTFIVGDERVPVREGTTIYVPPGTWHGMENPDSDVDIVFVVTPAGLIENFFRNTMWNPAGEPKQVSEDEMIRLSDLYDSIARPD